MLRFNTIKQLMIVVSGLCIGLQLGAAAPGAGAGAGARQSSADIEREYAELDRSRLGIAEYQKRGDALLRKYDKAQLRECQEELAKVRDELKRVQDEAAAEQAEALQ